METIANIYKTLQAVNFYFEVTIACLGVYFLAKNLWIMDKAKSSYIVIAISFIGQVAFSSMKDMQDAFMIVTMGIVQSVVAIGAYSFLESYGIWDKIGTGLSKFTGKKIDEKIGDNTPTEPKP